MNNPPQFIQVELFAQARELAGTERVSIRWHEQLDAADVLTQLGESCLALQSLLPSCRLAVDMQYVGSQAIVPAGAQLALIPPVSGG